MGMARFHGLLVFVLLLVNLLLVAFVLVRQGQIEAEKVGGMQNYKMVKQIYRTDMFKEQQTQQIQQALNVYQAGVDNSASQEMPIIMNEEAMVE